MMASHSTVAGAALHLPAFTHSPYAATVTSVTSMRNGRTLLYVTVSRRGPMSSPARKVPPGRRIIPPTASTSSREAGGCAAAMGGAAAAGAGRWARSASAPRAASHARADMRCASS